MPSVSEVLSLLPTEKRRLAHTWAGYSIQFLPLTASAAGTTLGFATQDGSEFIIMRIGAYVTTTAAPPVENVVPQATFSITIGSYKLFPDDKAHHVAPYSLSAADHRGHELEFPALVQNNTTVSIAMTNLTAVDMNVRWMLWGVRLIAGPKGVNDL